MPSPDPDAVLARHRTASMPTAFYWEKNLSLADIPALVERVRTAEARIEAEQGCAEDEDMDTLCVACQGVLNAAQRAYEAARRERESATDASEVTA